MKNKWIYKGKEFLDEDIPTDAVGFIYGMRVVINDENKMYIGKKNFYANRNVKKGKKELEAMTDKRGSKKKLVSKLNYQKYVSSNATIKEVVANGGDVEKVILKICFSKMELTYEETRYLFKLDVLLSDKYLNDNILGKFYKSKLQNNEESKETV